MNKNIHPSLPASVGGGGVPIIGGNKQQAQQQVQPPPEPPWDMKKCFALIVPLMHARPETAVSYLFKNQQDDPKAGIHAGASGSVIILRSLSKGGSAGGIAIDIVRHDRIDLAAVGFILEIIDKPMWFETEWKRAFPEVDTRVLT